MNGEESKSGLHIDSDWKTEAAREKELLAQQEQRQAGPQAEAEAGAGASPELLIDMNNLLAIQATVGLGGYQGPGGERIPANLAAAKHHIDLLEVLEKKTTGNLTEEEKSMLGGVLYELRMHYVQRVSAPSPPPDPPGPAKP